ncbi:lycopene cyclase domain-containing protein [Pedobacter changchengzhani]|uniref:Lycopene cyclase domain-containing protein n=1 Tax=Pedobacter changchengzhani TaxID=2529274 RepID=A0A4R5MH99_9SPHI|nr:lycopene cyclase domain-containing protein [Pedobacter changchengzhani]TDG34841.1 lycopene cyclase domain-containing protein [Pedobacter changchengzhani]
MKYTYLLINIFVILFPLALSFDKKVFFFKKWKFVAPAILITGAVFLVWDLLFTQLNIWSFNPGYIVGIYLWGLPLEEMLFFLTVPYACIFIYECLNAYFPKNILGKFSFALSNLILGFCVAVLFFAYHRWYVLINFTFLFFVLGYVEYINQKFRFMYKFYRMYLVSLVPFYIVNGFLTSIPVVLYNNKENLGVRVGTIPLEDHFYLMALLLMNIYLFEFFKSRGERKPIIV